MAGSVLQLLDGLRQQLGEELDLRNEARALRHFRRLQAETGLDRLLVVPNRTRVLGARVLTMEFLDGVAIDDLAQASALGLDPAPWWKRWCGPSSPPPCAGGRSNGDLHAGNMLLLRDGDSGSSIGGSSGASTMTPRVLLAVLEAVLGDERAWADVTAHLTAVYGPAIQVGLGLTDEELAVFLRQLVEPALTRPFGEVSLYGLLQRPSPRRPGPRAQAQRLPASWCAVCATTAACAASPSARAAS